MYIVSFNQKHVHMHMWLYMRVVWPIGKDISYYTYESHNVILDTLISHHTPSFKPLADIHSFPLIGQHFNVSASCLNEHPGHFSRTVVTEILLLFGPSNTYVSLSTQHKCKQHVVILTHTHTQDYDTLMYQSQQCRK